LGAIALDVDDTLLARPPFLGEAPTPDSGQRVGAVILSLLKGGVRVILITGHGWEQLRRRWVGPLLRQYGGPAEGLQIYANRGATKLAVDGGRVSEDRGYRDGHVIAEAHREAILQVLRSLQTAYLRDFEARASWYRQTFPRFDFDQLPAVSLREEVVAELRPLPSRAHTAHQGEDVRAQIAARGRHELDRSGLLGRYELGESGKSTIEVVRRGVSKRLALEDTIRTLAARADASTETIERALIYVGDEFSPGGNDHVISTTFPRCLCVSVSPVSVRGEGAENVVELPALLRESGPAAALAFLSLLHQELSGNAVPLV
jgi:hypothetical protein